MNVLQTFELGKSQIKVMYQKVFFMRWTGTDQRTSSWRTWWNLEMQGNIV